MNINKTNFFNELTAIVILYRSTNLVLKLIKQLTNIKILVVDNGGNEKILKEIKEYDNIQIISKKKNLGHGRGANYAFQFIKTKYFIILSPDVIIDEENILKLLLNIRKFDNCAIIAPVTKDDKDYYGIFPEKGKGIIRNKIEEICSKNLEGKSLSGIVCVDVVKGCTMLVNSELFKKIGMFNEKYFLFWEEIDLCRKVRKNKLSVIIDNNSSASHASGFSSKNDYLTFFIKSYHYELSPLIYFDVKKNAYILYWRLVKYIFRTLTYLISLNFKNSVKNFAKFSATLSYIIKV
tara:strand:+ start:380 stop:1258 length:879 start_codon:yes stop_codon:yes gene_type:complete